MKADLKPERELNKIIESRMRKHGMWSAIERIAREHRVDAMRVIGNDRFSSIAAARHHTWAVIRWTLGMSYTEIAIFFSVDHTTVMSGVRKYEKQLEKEYMNG